MEHVVSDERLRRIIGRAYRAGEAGEERYTQLLADGPEMVVEVMERDSAGLPEGLSWMRYACPRCEGREVGA